MEKHDPPTFEWTPPKERRKGLTALLLGLTGLVLVGLCGIGAWIVDGRSQTQSTHSPSPSAPTAVAAATPSRDDHVVELLADGEPGLGARVRTGPVEYRVTNQRCGVPEVGTNAGSAGEPSRGHFCVVTLEVRNLGRNAQVFTAADQVGYTTTGDRYLGSAAATRYANGSSRSFLAPIGPGAVVTGVIAFDLPKGSRLDSVCLRSTAAAGTVSVSLS